MYLFCWEATSVMVELARIAGLSLLVELQENECEAVSRFVISQEAVYLL